ncbi:hypothetical protein [Sphingomonas sp. NBWT7]|uniref:hypothetical protein n=1 Tax=Sphingomonas sp. NBWT7 TaxID=2596913 RepID=UPI001CA4D7DC|nr:hypothetical protein [Sphingomonas sp. NBWT7]
MNALRLVIHPFRPLRRTELTALFNRGLTSLSQSRRLQRSLIDGITQRVWQRLCDDMVFEAAVITGLEIFASPVFETANKPTDRDAMRAIRHNLRNGWPVLIALMDSYNHTTVVSSYSRTRINLFDSSEHCWVWVRSISFDPARIGDPHFVPAASVVALLAY